MAEIGQMGINMFWLSGGLGKSGSIVHGSNETGENWHQNKHCLRILLKCYENSGKSRLGGM